MGWDEKDPGKSLSYGHLVFLQQRVNPPQFEKHCCKESKLWKKGGDHRPGRELGLKKSLLNE